MAATLTFGDAMRGITYPSIIGWALLSTLSGVTALFYRIDRELKRTGRPLPNPGVFIVAHLGGSWAAGALAFFAGEGFGAPGLATAASIILMSFGGAALLERLAERQIRAALGDPPIVQPKEAP